MYSTLCTVCKHTTFWTIENGNDSERERRVVSWVAGDVASSLSRQTDEDRMGGMLFIVNLAGDGTEGAINTLASFTTSQRLGAFQNI